MTPDIQSLCPAEWPGPQFPSHPKKRRSCIEGGNPDQLTYCAHVTLVQELDRWPYPRWVHRSEDLPCVYPLSPRTSPVPHVQQTTMNSWNLGHWHPDVTDMSYRWRHSTETTMLPPPGTQAIAPCPANILAPMYRKTHQRQKAKTKKTNATL